MFVGQKIALRSDSVGKKLRKVWYGREEGERGKGMVWNISI